MMRGGDILFSLLLVAYFKPEQFARIALVQAWITPFLFFMVSPELALYAQYSDLKRQGRVSLESALKAFSIFAWGKLQFALILTAVIAWWSGESVFLIGWAWLQALGVQFLGPEREFLRLDHRIKDLARLTLIQKWGAVALMGVTLASVAQPLHWIWLSQALALIAAKIDATRCVKKAISEWPPGGTQSTVTDVLVAHLSHFSIWNHLNGVALNLILTLDVLVWSFFGGMNVSFGNYTAALKMVNVSFAIPFALSNWIGVQVSRIPGATPGVKNSSVSFRALSQFWVRRWTPVILGSGFLIFGVIAVGLRTIGPLKWGYDGIEQMSGWLPALLVGAVLIQLSFVVTAVMTSQGKVKQQFFELYLPAVVGAIGIYVASVWAGGMFTGLDALARGNVWVGLWVLGLALRMHWRAGHEANP